MSGALHDHLAIPDVWPEPTAEHLSRYECLPGKVAVLMCQPRTRYGELHLPDTLAGRTRGDAGVVIASAIRELRQGDRVYCRPYTGAFIETDEGGVREWVRLFCLEGDEEHEAFSVPWWEHIVAIEDGDGFRPLGHNVVIERDLKRARIELLESFETNTGILLSVGEDAFTRRVKGRRIVEEPLRVGDRVVYANHVDGLTFDFGPERSLFVAPDESVLAVME